MLALTSLLFVAPMALRAVADTQIWTQVDTWDVHGGDIGQSAANPTCADTCFQERDNGCVAATDVGSGMCNLKGDPNYQIDPYSTLSTGQNKAVCSFLAVKEVPNFNGLNCADRLCDTATSACVAIGGTGSSCSVDGDCTQGNCNDGICGSHAATCSNPWDCVSTKCSGGFCVHSPNLGEACNNPELPDLPFTIQGPTRRAAMSKRSTTLTGIIACAPTLGGDNVSCGNDDTCGGPQADCTSSDQCDLGAGLFCNIDSGKCTLGGSALTRRRRRLERRFARVL